MLLSPYYPLKKKPHHELRVTKKKHRLYQYELDYKEMLLIFQSPNQRVLILLRLKNL